MVVSAVALWSRAELGSVMLAASACFIAATVAGLVAGAKLLPTGRPVWYGTILAAVVMGVVLVFSGVFLVIPVLLAAAAFWYTRERKQSIAEVVLPEPDPVKSEA